MKLIQTIKKHLPVSRKTHEATLHKAHQEADTDRRYLMTQLSQTVRRNVALETRLVQAGVQHIDQE